jgi:hypothetical protein
LSADNGVPEEETGRGRGFFGILPSLLGGEVNGPPPEHRDAGRVEPMTADVGESTLARSATEPDAHHPGGSAEAQRAASLQENLSSDELRALRATLHELDECKRLLDGALSED